MNEPFEKPNDDLLKQFGFPVDQFKSIDLQTVRILAKSVRDNIGPMITKTDVFSNRATWSLATACNMLAHCVEKLCDVVEERTKQT